MSGIRELREYHQAYKAALGILYSWDDEDAPVLLGMFQRFVELVKPLVDAVDPEWSNCRALGRHMTFMERNLSSGQKQFSKSDAVDIVYSDLPSFADFLFSNISTADHLDERLAQATSRLFEIEDYASVIRASFPVLSSRLRRIFGIPDGSDGENLINDIFTRGLGSNPVVLPQEEKVAYRNLLAGFYATYRNKWNHGDHQPTFSQAQGVVEMTSTLIKDLELLAEASLISNNRADPLDQ